MKIDKTEDRARITSFPPAPCSVCGEMFQADEDLDFVCQKCQSALAGHCCDSDDVRMSWDFVTEGNLPYYWIIQCVCGNELRSRLHSLSEQDAVAKEIHKEWTSRKPVCKQKSVTEELNELIALHGNARDALNVTLAKLRHAQDRIEVLEDAASVNKSGECPHKNTEKVTLCLDCGEIG